VPRIAVHLGANIRVISRLFTHGKPEAFSLRRGLTVAFVRARLLRIVRIFDLGALQHKETAPLRAAALSLPKWLELVARGLLV
jgi:hypothetical protein